MTVSEKFIKLTGETDTDIATIMLERAEDFILGYTNRSVLPAILENTKLDIAVIIYNKSGSEGFMSHSEGGVSVSFGNESIPNDVLKRLNVFRLGRVGGVVFEKKIDEEIQGQEP